eukprot:s708_g19.t1
MEMVNNMRPEDVPPGDWLRQALYKKIRYSNLLMMHDVKQYESWDEGDGRKTYRHLRNVIERTIARVKEEDKHVAARDRYAREYAGTGKPGAPAPATPTPKVSRSRKAILNRKLRLRKPGAFQSLSPKDKKKIPCHFHFVKKACKKGKECEYGHDQKVFDNGKKKKDGKNAAPALIHGFDSDDDDHVAKVASSLPNGKVKFNTKTVESITYVKEDYVEYGRRGPKHKGHNKPSRSTEEVRKDEQWSFDCCIAPSRGKAMAILMNNKGDYAGMDEVHVVSGPQFDIKMAEHGYGDWAKEICEESYIEHVPGKFGVKGNAMCITVSVEEGDKKFIMDSGSGHDLIARRKIDRESYTDYEKKKVNKRTKRGKKKIAHEVAVGWEEDSAGQVEDNDSDEDEYPPSIAGDAPDVEHGVEIDDVEPGEDDGEDVIESRAKMKHRKSFRGAFQRKLTKFADLVTFDYVDDRQVLEQDYGVEKNIFVITLVFRHASGSLASSVCIFSMLSPTMKRCSAWCKLHGEEFKGKMIPCGALVFFKPSGAREIEQKRKLDHKGIPGVFAGYDIAPGLHWTRKYRVWSLSDWTKQSLAYNAGKPVPKLKTRHFTERVGVKESVEFSCKENYEKINASIEGLKEKDRLDGSPDYLPLPPPDDDEDHDDDDGGDDDKGDGGGDGQDGGKGSVVDPEILAEMEKLEFVRAEDAVGRAELPPPPGLDAPAPSSSPPSRIEVPEDASSHEDHAPLCCGWKKGLNLESKS